MICIRPLGESNVFPFLKWLMIWSSKCKECGIYLLLLLFSPSYEISPSIHVCKGFAGGAGETGEQSQKVWCCDTPTTERMSPLSV